MRRLLPALILAALLAGCSVQWTDPPPTAIPAPTPAAVNVPAAETAAAALRAVVDAQATLRATFNGPTQTPAPAATTGPAPVPVALGTPVSLDAWTVIVTGTMQQPTIGYEGTLSHVSRAQGVWVDVFATIHNGATTSQSMKDAQWTLIDRQGAHYVMLGTQTSGLDDSYLFHTVEVGRAYLSQEVIPRGDLAVVATFDVAADAPQVGLTLDLGGQSQVILGAIPMAPPPTETVP